MTSYKNLLKQNEITIFSKNDCKYCNLVKETFKELEITKINEINVSVMDENTYKLLIDGLKNDTNHRTFPFVFIDTIFCGGNAEIQEKKALGTLFEILKKYNIDFNEDKFIF